jgi:hypothetical protein
MPTKLIHEQPVLEDDVVARGEPLHAATDDLIVLLVQEDADIKFLRQPDKLIEEGIPDLEYLRVVPGHDIGMRSELALEDVDRCQAFLGRGDERWRLCHDTFAFPEPAHG